MDLTLDDVASTVGAEEIGLEDCPRDGVGPPSHNAQNWIGTLPSFAAKAEGSLISGVVLHTSQWRSVSVHPLSMYSPSYYIRISEQAGSAA